MSEEQKLDLTNEEKLLCYRQAGKIAYEVMEELKEMIKPGALIIDICKKGQKLILEKEAKPSFPVNVSINNIAAHYSSPHKDETTIPENAVVKLDLGAQVSGFISDKAMTIDLSGKWEKLVNASKDAYKSGLDLARIGEETIVLGRAIEKTIKDAGYLPLRELSGHLLDRYLLHGQKTIPNIAIPFGRAGALMEANECYALETFATTGTGSVKESMNRKYIYNLIPTSRRVPIRSRETKRIYSYIIREFQTLPFASLWLMENEDFTPARVRFAINELTNSGAIHGYGILSDIEESVVSQYENTFYLAQDGRKIVTTLPPFDFEFPDALKQKLKEQEEFIKKGNTE